MCKKVYICLIIFLSFISAFIFINIDNVSATYKYCNEKIDDTEYYDCGRYIYTYYEDALNSTIIFSTDKNRNILYAGEIDGVSIFYARGFEFYNRSYDDRSDDNNNLWTELYYKGKIVYSGKFKDSWLLDDSHSGSYGNLYKDSYTIIQYVNDGDRYRTIIVNNLTEGDIRLLDTSYNNSTLTNGVNEILEANKDMVIDFSSRYGLKSVNIKINNIEVKTKIEDSKIIISKEEINDKLIRGEVVEMKITIGDYFNFTTSSSYKLLLVNDEASIKFNSIGSITESSSRRIVIDAIAGKGKQLDTDYCWYYWSTSPDHSLLYDDFLKNYANSEYKGSYSEDKGVILRNTSGTYYLYALAKDEDSWVVAKSEGYLLNNEGYKVYYNVYDYILIVSLLIIAIIPISIYLYIGKKDY